MASIYSYVNLMVKNNKGSGTGCTINYTGSGGQVTSPAPSAGGSGYALGDVLWVAGGNGDGTVTVTGVNAAGAVTG